MAADLLVLQGNIKRDAAGYKDEFMVQFRHYKATLDLFNLKPSKEARDFQDLVGFMAQVCHCYPKETVDFPKEVMTLLEQHHAVLDPALRRSLVQSLILLRNRGVLDSLTILPLFFRLFRVQDKQLREQLFSHIIADIKSHNKKSKNEKFNRPIQNFLYGMVSDENESSAKRSLAVLTELYRRGLWRDARSVNVIASACFHKSPRVMLAALKFFLGHDPDDVANDEDEDEAGDEGSKRRQRGVVVAGPSKEDLYKAFHKGTHSSKKKKQKKIERTVRAMKKEARKEDAEGRTEGFAAIQLLHDPQTFAEKLFSKLQTCKERFETRLALMQLISRVVGFHRLFLLNFYPFLQRYMLPQQKEVTAVLATLVQAVHDLVPPDALEPVLRQLVDNFVHDKARPEVMTVGLRSVRELCLRQPLVMTEDLLRDLVLYRKNREKEVSNAARSLQSLFREIAPHLLEKKDRGRGAEEGTRRREYGATEVKTRVEGAELLQQAIRDGVDLDNLMVVEEDDEELSGSELGSDIDLDDLEDASEGEEGEGSEKGEEGEEEGGSDKDEDEEGLEWGSDIELESGEEEEEGEEEEGDDEEEEEEEEEEEAPPPRRGGKRGRAAKGEEEEGAGPSKKARGDKAKKEAEPESLATLKKKLAEVKAAKEAEAAPKQDETFIEYDRILTQEDFENIKKLREKAMMERAMTKTGLKSASKKGKGEGSQREAKVQEQDEELRRLIGRGSAALAERKINPSSLLGNHKRRKDKEERMASIMEGRKDREGFGAAAKLKKQKVAGLSNKEKARKKVVPVGARVRQIRRRMVKKNSRNAKDFKGRMGRIRR